MFFCQVEAAETAIYLVEAAEKLGDPPRSTVVSVDSPDEYEKVAAMDVRTTDDRITITLEAKPGTQFDRVEIEACLDYTVANAQSACANVTRGDRATLVDLGGLGRHRPRD